VSADRHDRHLVVLEGGYDVSPDESCAAYHCYSVHSRKIGILRGKCKSVGRWLRRSRPESGRLSGLLTSAVK
jgi:hypothetical protein